MNKYKQIILAGVLLSSITLMGCNSKDVEKVEMGSTSSADENTTVERIAKIDYLDKTDLKFNSHLYSDGEIGVTSDLKSISEDAKINIYGHTKYKDSEKFRTQVTLAMQACGGTEKDANDLLEKINYYMSDDFIKSKEAEEYINVGGDFYKGIDINDSLSIWIMILGITSPEDDPYRSIEIVFSPKKDHSEYISNSKLDFNYYKHENEYFSVGFNPFVPEFTIDVLEGSIENSDFNKELELIISLLGGDSKTLDEIRSVFKNAKKENEYVDVFIGEKYKLVIGLQPAPLKYPERGRNFTIGIYEVG